MSRLALPALTLVLCACGSDLASPFSAVAVTYDVNKQAFKLAQVRINTLTSLRHLQGCLQLDAKGNCQPGTKFDVTAGGSVRVSTAAVRDPSATVDSLRAAFVKTRPAQVEVSWNVLNDIVYAEDFASLELLSTYYNMEKARKALADWGLTTLPAKPIVAHAAIADENGLSPLAAGELYYAPLAIFYTPVATPQQAVPSAFNLGAVAHALGHEAVEEQVWAGTPAPTPERGTNNAAKHLARSFAEGVGDYLGVAVSDDPRWFDHPLQQDAAARALDQIHCSTPDMLAALAVDDAQARYDPYPLGSVFAGALWEEASQATAQNTSRGVLAALADLGTKAAAAQGVLKVPDILDALAAHAPVDQRNGLCGLFLNRFAQLGIKATDLPSCVNATPRAECQ
jgi:hypothetical protein